MFNNLDKQIIKKIKEYKTIVIARHIGPDPDAIASQIALRDIIRLNFEDKEVYAVGIGVSKFKFIGTMDKIDNINKEEALLIILDVPEFVRVDGAKKDEYAYTIKIDHHPCDHPECDIDLIDESACSTCQILSQIVFNNDITIE